MHHHDTDGDHHTGIGSHFLGQLTSAGCTCGWSYVLPYNSPRFEAGALFYVKVLAALHEYQHDITDGLGEWD